MEICLANLPIRHHWTSFVMYCCTKTRKQEHVQVFTALTEECGAVEDAQLFGDYEWILCVKRLFQSRNYWYGSQNAAHLWPRNRQLGTFVASYHTIWGLNLLVRPFFLSFCPTCTVRTSEIFLRYKLLWKALDLSLSLVASFRVE